MTVFLPVECGIAYMILDSMAALFTKVCTTAIPITDASRATTIQIGPLQDDPTSVMLLLYENDPENPASWSHKPVRYRNPRPASGAFLGSSYDTNQMELQRLQGYELMGGGSQRARCFTVDTTVFGDDMAADIDRHDAGRLASLVENRWKLALREAGGHIGTDYNPIKDSFGESVALGPYFDESWTIVQAGEALIVRKRCHLFYICTEEWNATL